MLICGKIKCEKQANGFIKRKDARKRDVYYCSPSCALADLNRRESLIQLDPTGKFSSEAHGDRSPVTSHSEPTIKKEPMIQKEYPTNKEAQRSVTMQIQKKVEPLPEKNVRGISIESEPETERDQSQKGVSLIQKQNSEGSLPDYEEVILASKSLVDQSIVSMHGLIQSVVENIQHKNIHANHKHVDPAQVNAAANCAKQMGELLKIKVMLHKESSKR